MNKTIFSTRFSKLITYHLAITLFALFLLPKLTLAQTASVKPITKNGLIQALKIGGLSQNELINQVTRRGVDFTLSSDAEADLRHAGASGDLLKAVRENYHEGANPDNAALAALDTPDPAETPASRPSSHSSTESAGSAKRLMNLRDVRKLYIDKMPNGLDGYLRAAISRKLGSFFTIVLERREADAILQATDNRSSGTVSIVDPSGKVVLWSGSADDKDKAYLNFRHGGERQVAEKLASQLKKSLD